MAPTAATDSKESRGMFLEVVSGNGENSFDVNK